MPPSSGSFRRDLLRSKSKICFLAPLGWWIPRSVQTNLYLCDRGWHETPCTCIDGTTSPCFVLMAMFEANKNLTHLFYRPLRSLKLIKYFVTRELCTR